MDESKLVAAICNSRSALEKLDGIGLDPQNFGEAAACIVAAAAEQYGRDPDVQAIDVDVLRAQVQRRFGAGSMADSAMDFALRLPDDVSQVNLVEEYRLLRLDRVATTLATLLATGQHGDETSDLLAKYSSLVAAEEGEAFKPRLTFADFTDDAASRVALSPRSLNDYIGGGVLRGHNITVYGRPESGKSLFAINQAAAACVAGQRVLYVANEEPAQEITKRLLSRLANVDILRLRDPEILREAFARCTVSYANFNLLHRAGCSSRDISRQCARLRPDFVIVDQLKNLHCADDNRALQLDAVARQVREIGIAHDCVTMSITQAGESAQNKLVLGMTDIEWSNTGIPGAADLMIGIGADEEYLSTNKRMLSVPKNKANGKHGCFPVWINPQRTAVLSRARA